MAMHPCHKVGLSAISEMVAEDFAFLKIGPDAFACGGGGFASAAEPPKKGAAFYVNDFALSDERPWKAPEEFEIRPLAGLPPARLNGERPRVKWDRLSEGPFEEVFADIKGDIADGHIKKSVPVLTEKGRLLRGTPWSLAEVVQRLPEPFISYGYARGEEGFVGATPEEFFRLEGRKFETMALAGTAPASRRAEFLNDPKEVQEHELVAQYLVQHLADLGEVRRGPRECMDLGPIVHFLTRISVELSRPRTVGGLIRRMHPTPALGSFPRTLESLRKLYDYRSQLAAPRGFGAPFGVIVDGVFSSVVAIRNVSWSREVVSLPSGCGVIEESTLANEWAELALKRRSVKEILGL